MGTQTSKIDYSAFAIPKPGKKTKKKSRGFNENESTLIWERDEGTCRQCGKPVPKGTKPHHKKPRGMGGTRNPEVLSVDNGELDCNECHYKEHF